MRQRLETMCRLILKRRKVPALEPQPERALGMIEHQGLEAVRRVVRPDDHAAALPLDEHERRLPHHRVIKRPPLGRRVRAKPLAAAARHQHFDLVRHRSDPPGNAHQPVGGQLPFLLARGCRLCLARFRTGSASGLRLALPGLLPFCRPFEARGGVRQRAAASPAPRASRSGSAGAGRSNPPPGPEPSTSVSPHRRLLRPTMTPLLIAREQVLVSRFAGCAADRAAAANNSVMQPRLRGIVLANGMPLSLRQPKQEVQLEPVRQQTGAGLV